jgi:hypothetical protein
MSRTAHTSSGRGALPEGNDPRDERDDHAQQLEHITGEDADLARIGQLVNKLARDDRGDDCTDQQEERHDNADNRCPAPRPQGDQGSPGQQDDRPRRDRGIQVRTRRDLHDDPDGRGDHPDDVQLASRRQRRSLAGRLLHGASPLSDRQVR